MGTINRSGLLPRFLHCETAAATTDDISFDLRRATISRSNFTGRIRELVETFRFETSPAVTLPTKAARALMQQIESDSKQNSFQDESICGEILRRRAEQIWRVALCLHAAEYGAKASLTPLELKTAQCAQLIVEHCHG